VAMPDQWFFPAPFSRADRNSLSRRAILSSNRPTLNTKQTYVTAAPVPAPNNNRKRPNKPLAKPAVVAPPITKISKGLSFTGVHALNHLQEDPQRAERPGFSGCSDCLRSLQQRLARISSYESLIAYC
jgi:hypothetical protein